MEAWYKDIDWSEVESWADGNGPVGLQLFNLIRPTLTMEWKPEQFLGFLLSRVLTDQKLVRKMYEEYASD